MIDETLVKQKISAVILEVAQEKMEVSLNVDEHASLIDYYGIDSLTMISCLVKIEQALGLHSINYENMPLTALDNIANLTNFYSTKMPHAS